MALHEMQEEMSISRKVKFGGLCSWQREGTFRKIPGSWLEKVVDLEVSFRLEPVKPGTGKKNAFILSKEWDCKINTSLFISLDAWYHRDLLEALEY